jgi:hypothetical protein
MIDNGINLILIDSSIDDLNGFINGINNNTKYIIFNNGLDTYETIKQKISQLNLTNIQSIAIANHGSSSLEFKMLNTEPINLLSDLTSWNEFKNFLLNLKIYHIENVDLLGCNLLQQPLWNNVFTMLESDL